jgi:hypothetical protein
VGGNLQRSDLIEPGTNLCENLLVIREARLTLNLRLAQATDLDLKRIDLNLRRLSSAWPRLFQVGEVCEARLRGIDCVACRAG